MDAFASTFGVVLSATPTKPHPAMTSENVFEEIQKVWYLSFSGQSEPFLEQKIILLWKIYSFSLGSTVAAYVSTVYILCSWSKFRFF